MRKRISYTILTAGILILLAQTLFAQPPMDPERREMMRERIETLKLWKMIEFMDLSSEQSDEFLPILHEFQKAKKELEMARRQLFKDLEEELESKEPDEKTIEDILFELEENRVKLEKERERFIMNSSNALSRIQLGKLLLFEQRFERELRDTIRKFRMKPGRHFEEG